MDATITTDRLLYDKVLESTPRGERLKMCLQCGSCSGICPYGYAMDFTPHMLIAQLRAAEIEPILKSDTIWLCASCYACTNVCPVQIPLTAGVLTTFKAELLTKGKVPSELQVALENTRRYGNTLGESPRKRADWAGGLATTVPVMAVNRKPVDVLWYVGDYASYHLRVQSVSKALAAIFQALGINFGILGPEENNDGDFQCMTGESGLYEMMAIKNGKTFRKYQFREIVTTDPHAYNIFKNGYPSLGHPFPVKHHTQFLAERIDQLKPLFKREIKLKVTFHDPCYLGRVNSNNVYEEPRALLTAIPGVEFIEMPHNRTNTLCCGGGGGGNWLDGFTWEKTHARMSEWRVQEADEVGAQVLVVACPFETPRFEDAIKSIGINKGLIVKDIAELLAEAMTG